MVDMVFIIVLVIWHPEANNTVTPDMISSVELDVYFMSLKILREGSASTAKVREILFISTRC